MAGVLFEDIFDVKDIDPEGKKFDRGECIFLKFIFSVLPSDQNRNGNIYRFSVEHGDLLGLQA